MRGAERACASPKGSPPQKPCRGERIAGLTGYLFLESGSYMFMILTMSAERFQAHDMRQQDGSIYESSN
jgi:hypothetical protein